MAWHTKKLKCGCEIEVFIEGGKATRTRFPENPPLDCPKVWDMICEGLTWGIFQIEKQAGQRWSKEYKPRTIEEMAVVQAIIRPGCADVKIKGKTITEKICLRKHGKEKIEYMHEAIKDVTEKTQGFLVYQEQAMKTSQIVAGFSGVQAETLRKAAGKKNVVLMEKVKGEFVEGVEKSGVVSKEEGEEIFKGIEASQRYSFNACLDGESTYVQKTDYSLLRLKDVQIGDEIRSPYGPTKVVRIYDNGIKNTVKVHLNNKKTIICTMDHQFMTFEGNKKTLSKILDNGSRLIDSSGWAIRIEKVEPHGRIPVMDIEVDDIHHLFYANDIATSNSHAISYSYNAYYFSAYMKAHFPRAFYMGKMQYADDNDKIAEVLNDAPKLDITILPPSLEYFNAEPLIKDGCIVYPLGKIKHVSEATIKTFKSNMGEHLDKPYLYWLTAGTNKINSSAVKHLILSGAMDFLKVPRKKMLDEYEIAKSLTPSQKEFVIQNHAKPFLSILNEIMGGGTGKGKLLYNKVSERSLEEKIKLAKIAESTTSNDIRTVAMWEKEFLGREMTCTELDTCDTYGSNVTCLDIFHKRCAQKGLRLPLIISRVKLFVTKKGDLMAFVEGYDLTGSLNNIVVFNDAYKKFNEHLFEGNKVMLVGSLSDRGGFIVNHANTL